MRSLLGNEWGIMDKCISAICLFCLSLALLIPSSRSSLISKSAIVDCNSGSSADSLPSAGGGGGGGGICKKMLLVSMTVKGDAGPGESIYANVDRAYQEGDEEMSRMKKPFRLEIIKSEVIASYRVLYKKSVNAQPSETVITLKGCRDGWGLPAEQVPCRYQLDSDGKRVWDSQGFCCVCQSIKVLRRGKVICDPLAILQKYSSAHCMANHDLWYEVFTVQEPMLQYNITIRMYEFSGMAEDLKTGKKFVKWSSVSNFTLSPSLSMGRSKDGRVLAEVQGNLLGDRTVQDFSYKYLLIPSIHTWPKDKELPVQYTNGPSDWMLIDKHEFELRGDVCNKIGVSYTAFRFQPGQCDLSVNSCFVNQPLDYWNRDNERRKQGKTGMYFLSNYGEVDPSTHPNNNSFILRFRYKHFHNTMVTFRIDASDISFVQSVGSGRIISAEASDLMALKTKGVITVVVENTGELSGEFSVSVHKCTYGVHRLPAQAVSIDPGKTEVVRFTVMTFVSVDEGASSFKCEVQLFDSAYNLLQTATVDFIVETTCYCTPSCGCSCSANETIRCPESPTRFVPGGSIFVRFLLLTLESIGVEGFVGFFGAIFIVMGFLKLSFGSVLCCRKTKAQEHAEKMREKARQRGKPPRGPILVRCSGDCRGARAAQAKYKRQLERLKRMGKSRHLLDDWRNYSYVCTCHAELSDVQFIHVIRAVCFFYYSCMLPFIWLGRKVYWGYFKDTAEQKQKAEQAVLNKARKKGKLDKYGVVDLKAELKKMEEITEGKQTTSPDLEQGMGAKSTVVSDTHSNTPLDSTVEDRAGDEMTAWEAVPEIDHARQESHKQKRKKKWTPRGGVNKRQVTPAEEMECGGEEGTKGRRKRLKTQREKKCALENNTRRQQ